MDRFLYVLTAICVVILVVTVCRYEWELAAARRERDAARLDLATEQALHLLTADQRDGALVDEARAVMHAEDAQLLLDAMVRHPSTRPVFAVLDGGK